MSTGRKTLVADQRGTAAEYVLLVGAVALAGVLGFVSLGDAMQLVIGGGATGATAPGTSPRVDNTALVAVPVAPMSAQAAGLADVARFLGRFDRSTVAPIEFVRRYAEDPASALERAVSPAARDYLNAEVLPILRATFVDNEGVSVRYISLDDERQIVTQIVSGNSARARANVRDAIQRYAESDSSVAGGKAPQDIAAVAHIAAEMFKPYWVTNRAHADWVPRARFSLDEAESLIHLRADAVAKLRARPGGGEVIADFVDALLARDFERSAGMPDGADVRGLEAWLRGAALADPDLFTNAEEITAMIVRGIPEFAANEMKMLLQHFEAADAL